MGLEKHERVLYFSSTEIQYQTFQPQPELVSSTEECLYLNICENERNSVISFSTPFWNAKINKKSKIGQTGHLVRNQLNPHHLDWRSTTLMAHQVLTLFHWYGK